MTTPSDNQTFETFLPLYSYVPEKWEEAKPFLVEQLKRIAQAINTREIGWYLDEELLAGKAFIPGSTPLSDLPTSEVFRQVFRKVIDFGALPNAAPKSIAHGITVDSNFTLVQLWASATDPVGFTALPIPYADAAGVDNIQLDMGPVNVNITTTTNKTAYSICYVTIEYLLEV